MPFLLAVIAGILIVAALRNTQGQLATELEQDIPPFFKWAAAVIAIGGIGYIPGLRVPARYVLALVFVVLVVANYQRIIAGFVNAAGSAPGAQPTQAPTTPAAAFVSNPNSPPITATEISGSSGGATVQPAAATSLPFNNPASILTAFETGLLATGGFA